MGAYTIHKASSLLGVGIDIGVGKNVNEIAEDVGGLEYWQNGPYATKVQGEYHPLGHIVKDGELINEGYGKMLEWSCFVVLKSGRAYIGKLPKDLSTVNVAWQGTPEILRGGDIVSTHERDKTNPDILKDNLRSGIFIGYDNCVYFIRTHVKHSLHDFAYLMRHLGGREGINLDGGGSVSGKGSQGWQRPVGSAIYSRGEIQMEIQMPELIIDGGHGGKDRGGGSNEHWDEKDIVLSISLYQYSRFLELGVEVALTRDTDKYIGPDERVKIVKESGAKRCISNHVNAGGGDGLEVIHSIYGDATFGKLVAKEMGKVGQNLRRVFSRTLPNNASQDYYYMHRNTGKVATDIIEYGFADSPKDDVEQLMDWTAEAESVVKAYCDLYGHKYSPPESDKGNRVFNDIPNGHWAEGSVKALKEEGILAGFPDGSFKGDEYPTRYEMAALLSRVMREVRK